MNLVAISALIAVCSAAKLDRTYLPPPGAKAAGRSSGSLQTPFASKSFNQGLGGLPKGGYNNEFQGVVVDAANAGTRASGPEESGLGLPRVSYGSTASKVGEAAFTGAAGFRQTGEGSQIGDEQGSGAVDGQTAGTQITQGFNRPQGFGQGAHAQGTQEPQGQPKSDRPQASFERASNTLKFESEVGPESFNYAFETDNGISAEENGVDNNGIQAQGGYSYTGDDGQVYSVSYTADENGYQPKGDHLPTPPPIPKEILKSLEQNAREEAAGIVDDGSYDTQKYNAGGDYTESDSANGQHNERQSSHSGNRPESDATASGTFINQSNQPFGKSNVLPGNIVSNKPAFNQPSQNKQPFGRPAGNNFQGQIGTGALSGDGSENNFEASPATNFGQGGQSSQILGSKKEYLPPTNGISQNASPSFGTTPQTQSSSVGSTSINNNNQGSLNFQPLAQVNGQRARPHSTTSSSAAVSGTPEISGQTQQFGGFQQSQINNVKPNQFNPNLNGRVPSSQGQAQISSRPLATAQPQTELSTPFETSAHDVNPTQSSASATAAFNSQSPNIRPSQSQFGFNTHVALQPLDSNLEFSRFGGTKSPQPPRLTATASAFQQGSNIGRAQSPFSMQSNKQNAANIPGQSSASSFASFGSRLSSSESKPFGSTNGQQPSTFSTTPQIQGQFNQETEFSNKQPKLSENQFYQNRPDNEPFSSNAEKSSFNQNTLQPQGPDSSYYYNQPSRPFGTAALQPSTHGAKFPSTASNQLNTSTLQPTIAQSSAQFSSSPQNKFPSTSSQNSQVQGSPRYPRPPTLAPASPTSETQNEGQPSPHFNGVTQASASSFTSGLPTPSTQFNIQQPGQFGSRPSLSSQPSSSQSGGPFFGQQGTTNQGFLQRPSQKSNSFQSPGISQTSTNENQSEVSKDLSRPSQQYDGEIYEYKKPTETLPAPSNKGASVSATAVTGTGQFGQKIQSEFSRPSRPEFGQQANTDYSSSTSRFDSQSSQGSRPTFGAQFKPQSDKNDDSDELSPFQIGSEPNESASGSIPFGVQSPKSQFGQTLSSSHVSSLNPNQATRPQFGSQPSRTFDSSSQPSQTELSSQPLLSSSTRPQGSRPQSQCCQGSISGTSQFGEQGSTQFGTPNSGRPNTFGLFQNQSGQRHGFPGASAASQSVAGKGEDFGGPRKPPSFDSETGYHY